ncbi:hypothetical protein ECG_01792 [Echinococcus granulosus]|uniref:Transposase n=1 Tax=Echinococcus granulosus TaxID=6210 RepID=A0A068W716_ECHGR|nr:hypothetical protein ECG_01792 [Echinococcus granulosus]CDS15264.1 hypothetical protein EgrG_000766000 [Echinococcus granulosus]
MKNAKIAKRASSALLRLKRFGHDDKRVNASALSAYLLGHVNQCCWRHYAAVRRCLPCYDKPSARAARKIARTTLTIKVQQTPNGGST